MFIHVVDHLFWGRLGFSLRQQAQRQIKQYEYPTTHDYNNSNKSPIGY